MFTNMEFLIICLSGVQAGVPGVRSLFNIYVNLHILKTYFSICTELLFFFFYGSVSSNTTVLFKCFVEGRTLKETLLW